MTSENRIWHQRSGAELVRGRDGAYAIRVPNGTLVAGRMPGFSGVTLLEHQLRDRLAFDVGGLTEATVPYGRVDVLTSTIAFEVEPIRSWRYGVRQALAYGAQTGCSPAVALFGAASSDAVLKMYLTMRDVPPPIDLWWWSRGKWDHITSRRACVVMRTPIA